MSTLIKTYLQLLAGLVYDHTEEGDLSKKKFSPRKFVVFLALSVLSAYFLVSMMRLYSLASDIKTLSSEKQVLIKQVLEMAEKNQELLKQLNTCPKPKSFVVDPDGPFPKGEAEAPRTTSQEPLF